MKTVTPEKSLAYWQHVEKSDPRLNETLHRHIDLLNREVKKAESERFLRELVWGIGAIASAVVFLLLGCAFIVLIWAAMQ
jgi:acyl-CoA hydrolase